MLLVPSRGCEVWGYPDSLHAADKTRDLEKAVTLQVCVMVQIRV